MKKRKCLLGAMVLSAALLAGCGAEGIAPSDVKDSGDAVTIVCTTFPQYDWIRSLVGEEEGFDIQLLVKNNTDIHNYQPSAQDMIAIRESDLFVYIGGESDSWVTDMVKTDEALLEKSVNLIEALGDSALVEEIIEGMEHDHDHHGEAEDHTLTYYDQHMESGQDGDAHEAEEEVMDEHIWLSVENAEILVSYLSERICEIAPDAAGQIAENTSDYLAQLHTLGEAYAEAASQAVNRTLIFGDRFPFRYLVEDYGLEYYAAFSGCNAEVEASFETIVFLAEKIDALGAKYILIIEGSDGALADTIRNSTSEKNQEILTLNSMQSISMDEIERGANYLDIMRDNLEILKTVLGTKNN